MRKPPFAGLAAPCTPLALHGAVALGVLTLVGPSRALAGEGVGAATTRTVREDRGARIPEGPAVGPLAPAESGPSRADAKSSAADDDDAEGTTDAPKPPRVDGPYFGGTFSGAGAFARVNDLKTPEPFSGFLLDLRAGDVVFPWLSIGIEVLGGAGWVSDQRIAHGGLLMDFGFYPLKRVPFSLRTGFGFGAGAVNDENEDRRFGFGGALFKAGARYAWFPGAAKRRPNRGGGFAVGPELNWLGYTPTGPGAPMNNVISLGLYTGFYFGD